MNNLIGRKNVDVTPFIVPPVFFIIVGVVFKLYAINFSPLLLLAVLYIYISFVKKVGNYPSHIDFLLLAGLIIVFFLAIYLLLTPSIFKTFPVFILNIFKFSSFGVSAIGFSMIIALLFGDLELSLVFAVFISLLGATIEGQGLGVGVSLFCASLSSAMLSRRLRKRYQIVKTCFYSGIVFFIGFMLESSANFSLMSSDYAAATILMAVVSSVITIAILPVIVTGVLYFFEYVFHVVTDISLLELSDNQPLLKRMILEAPGTYQHSLVVANLSESAADAVGANPLLARVGAYYHDVGKLNKPHYFAENQYPHKDAHKDLKPSMSKLIIMNHVKEGIELAEKYRLHPRLVDFIAQHHGRSLVYYFYRRAQAIDPTKESEYQEEYRYPGPKPQNKEIAIVSLADTIEALSRTLEEPTPSRIEEMVREVIRRRFLEGELDESGLTLKDLEKITQSITRVLNALFHTRVNYAMNNDKNNQPSKNKEDSP